LNTIYGVKLGNTVSVDLELYFGVGAAFDLSEGVKIGGPGWELSICFDWNLDMAKILGYDKISFDLD